MADDLEANLRAEYRALNREAVRLYRDAQACEERMKALMDPLAEAITERLWGAHPK